MTEPGEWPWCPDGGHACHVHLHRQVHEIRCQLDRLAEQQEAVLSALDNLKAADGALKAEVTQAITDWAAQLAAAGTDQAAIQAVADDMTAQVAALQAQDALNAPPPATA